MKRAVLTAFVLLGGVGFVRSQEPADTFADVQYHDGQLVIKYDGKLLFSGKVTSGGTLQYRLANNASDGKINQAIIFNHYGRGKEVQITGNLYGSDEAFSCAAERPRSGVPIVRHSFGVGTNNLDRAVYDRNRDWLFSVDLNPRVEIKRVEGPKSSEVEGGASFKFRISGQEIVMRFRPRYYQQHKGLRFYKPWAYKLWDKPVVGWCSWFAFWNRITEKDIKRTTDVLAVRLLPYGLEYIQLDDGFEQINGTPDKWLNPNKKFPSGLAALASYITSKGFKPGIRADVSFHDAGWARQHPQYFIKDKNGEVPREPWVGYPVDATNIRALDKLVRPIYSGLRQQGWKYIKLDSLRHLRYEGYNRHKDYFRKKNTTAVEALRTYVTAVKEELGDNILFMGCWGIRPELTGMIDACRVGGDGFSYAGLAQYNSFNNVVWQNDPDHIQLTPKEAYRSTMATSLTGSMYMLTDKPKVYNGEIIEAARRTIPVLRTLPGQVYEVDPRRIEHLADYEIEVSGTNHRPFDASLTSFVDLYQLDIHTSYESWVLLGRTANHEPGIDMKDLGLKPDKDYLVFEFWSKTYLGSFTGHIDFPDIDPKYHCQAFCIRERQLQPQLVATSRHISCGALEVSQLKAANTKDGFSLEGISVLVGEDPYVLYLTEPAGYQFKEIRVNGADVIKNEKQGMIRKITLRRKQSGQVKWELHYNH